MDPRGPELDRRVGDEKKQEKTSLASFIADVKLAWGIAKELEADGLYSFDYEEEPRACKAV